MRPYWNVNCAYVEKFHVQVHACQPVNMSTKFTIRRASNRSISKYGNKFTLEKKSNLAKEQSKVLLTK